MAPHHGSKAANVPELADWARPRVAVSSQGPPRGPGGVPEPYTAKGARFLSTWADGAVTIRSHRTGDRGGDVRHGAALRAADGDGGGVREAAQRPLPHQEPHDEKYDQQQGQQAARDDAEGNPIGGAGSFRAGRPPLPRPPRRGGL